MVSPFLMFESEIRTMLIISRGGRIGREIGCDFGNGEPL